MVEKKYCIYKHTCPNGKIYIGITKQNPMARWKRGLGYKNNKYFYNAIIKYGWDNIKHEILETELTEKEVSEMEVELIKKYRSAEKEYGYNIAKGGLEVGKSISDITRKKISESMIEQYLNGSRSRIRSEEAKRKASETFRQRLSNGEITRTISEEQKYKMSEAHKGKHLSEETKEKIRNNSKRKAVVQYDNEKVIKIYCGVREAGRQTGIDYTSIIKVLKGKKHTAGGYT